MATPDHAPNFYRISKMYPCDDQKEEDDDGSEATKITALATTHRKQESSGISTGTRNSLPQKMAPTRRQRSFLQTPFHPYRFPQSVAAAVLALVPLARAAFHPVPCHLEKTTTTKTKTPFMESPTALSLSPWMFHSLVSQSLSVTPTQLPAIHILLLF